MSHFAVIVMVSSEEKDVLHKVEELLAPYNENIEVPEYDDKCWCIGNKAERDAHEEANKKNKSIHLLRKEYDELPETQRGTWRDFIASWEQTMNRAIKRHPLFNKPDPECTSCKGAGVYKSTRNPKSKWDAWRVGGRWDGAILGDQQDSSNGFNFGSNHEELTHNMAKVSKMHKDFDPFALVTPDGKWHQSAEMGWFGLTRDENGKWGVDYKKLMAKYKDHWAIVVDCHI